MVALLTLLSVLTFALIVPSVGLSGKRYKSGFALIFRSVLDSEGSIGALAWPDCASLSRKQIDSLTEHVGKYGAKGLVWLRYTEDGLEGPIKKFISDTEEKNLITRTSATVGDMIFLIAASEQICYTALGQLRLEIGRLKHLIDSDQFQFVWVTEFPLFEFSEEENRYMSVHHPFTAPIEQDISVLETPNYFQARSRSYDLALNGFELGGGSIRIHILYIYTHTHADVCWVLHSRFRAADLKRVLPVCAEEATAR